MFKFLKKFSKKARSEKPKAIICDSSTLIYSLDRCKREKHIYLPMAHFTIIKRVAAGNFLDRDGDNLENAIISKKLAETALEYINNNKEWCTIVPRLSEERFFVDINKFKPRDKTKAIVALACEFVRQRYEVYVYTQTKQIKEFTDLQCNDSIKTKYFEMAA